MGKKEVAFRQAIDNDVDDLVDKHATYDVYLMVNTSDTNREPDEPTLFVGREPYQVRSLADSGVRYNFNMMTDKLKMSLENPIERPEYEIDSVLPVTPHKLCLSCLDALNYFCRYREQQAEVCHAEISVPSLSRNYRLSTCLRRSTLR